MQMRMSFRISLLTVALALVSPALAQAQAPRQVLGDFGMLGSWASDCSRPADGDNFYTIFVGMPDGNVRRTYYNTPAREQAYNEYIITRAIRLPADQLSYRQEGTVNHDKIDVILMKDGSKYKIWSSVKEDGEPLVKDGKYPKSGEESLWQVKCHD
jgi:hypothetical protein